MTNTHIMLDLETLGRSPGCKLLSIGAVVFSPAGLGERFYREVQINEQRDLVADAETIAWWHSQNADELARLYGSQRTKPTLAAALVEFADWLRSVSRPDGKGGIDACVWGNGADFDNAILAYCFGHFGLAVPWSFWNGRCYRTLKALRPGIRLTRTGMHHNALDDACSQAEHAVRLFAALDMA